MNTNYKTITVPFTENIKNYFSDFNAFHWIDNKNNWYTCDIFGRITNNGKVPDFESIEIINKNQFICSTNGRLIFQDLEKDQKTEIKIAEKSFKNFYYKDQILSIFTNKGISNYKITIP